jgi:hypothetical protein
MFSKYRIGAAGVALVAAMGMAGSASAATGSASATATILDSLQVVADSALDFGTIAATGAGTLTVNPDGTDNCTSSTTLTCTVGRAAAALHVVGNDGAAVNITLPSNTTSLTDGAGHSMNVTALTLSDATATLGSGGTAGQFAFTVGGTLNVNNGQSAGVYNGSFNVDVTYQ